MPCVVGHSREVGILSEQREKKVAQIAARQSHSAAGCSLISFRFGDIVQICRHLCSLLPLLCPQLVCFHLGLVLFDPVSLREDLQHHQVPSHPNKFEGNNIQKYATTE